MAFAPPLRPDLSLSELRRTAARLRSGAIRPADPRVEPLLLADLIEQGIAREMLVRWIVAELGGNAALHGTIEERNEEERARRLVAELHRLKEESAADPRAAQRFRRLNRERRNELGRPGRKS